MFSLRLRIRAIFEYLVASAELCEAKHVVGVSMRIEGLRLKGS